jgi:hypothetical protein
MTRIVIALALIVSPALVFAQKNRPIYPAYDGFVQNPDGSYTLAFAYFSHNAEPVTIEPGPDNSFSPNPGDRQQTTTFHPGHWRFQCVMVVGPEFDGKLRWTVNYAGTSTGTSQNMLQSNWNLVEGAAELKKIDYAKVPRGVCLNRAPSVRVLGLTARERTLHATTTEPLSLFGSVADEGLPRNAKLAVSWKQVSGPAPVTFQNAAVARTRATFSAPGSYELELSATDSEFSDATRVTVVVK